MRTSTLFFVLSAASLLIMVIVDLVIGSRAEFLNAYSVVERLLGREPSAGTSIVAQKLGSLGELCVVLAVNLAIGGILTGIARLLSRR